MYQELERCTEERDGVLQERRMLQIEQMLDREIDHATGRDTTVKSLFNYWRDKRYVGHLPLAETFDPKDLFSPDEIRWVSWIDVTSQNPFEFVLHDHPAVLFGDFSHAALSDHPYRLHAIRCAFEYDHCKKTQLPTYHEINQTIGGYHRRYVRLLLPTANEDGKITRLFYATRYLAEPIAA